MNKKLMTVLTLMMSERMMTFAFIHRAGGPGGYASSMAYDSNWRCDHWINRAMSDLFNSLERALWVWTTIIVWNVIAIWGALSAYTRVTENGLLDD